MALQQALKAEGISSAWLRRIADAPLMAADLAYDCALLDISLPDGCGLDLLARWRKAGITLPIIVITARSALGDRLAVSMAAPTTSSSSPSPRPN